MITGQLIINLIENTLDPFVENKNPYPRKKDKKKKKKKKKTGHVFI